MLPYIHDSELCKLTSTPTLVCERLVHIARSNKFAQQQMRGNKVQGGSDKRRRKEEQKGKGRTACACAAGITTCIIAERWLIFLCELWILSLSRSLKENVVWYTSILFCYSTKLVQDLDEGLNFDINGTLTQLYRDWDSIAELLYRTFIYGHDKRIWWWSSQRLKDNTIR